MPCPKCKKYCSCIIWMGDQFGSGKLFKKYECIKCGFKFNLDDIEDE